MNRFAIALAASTLFSCGGGPDPVLPGTDLEILDKNSYSFTGSLEIGSIGIEPGVDATVDWCALTTDLRTRDVIDPASVDQVLLVEFAMSQQEIMDKVSVNELIQSDTESQWLLEDPGACSVSLTDFQILANAFEPASEMTDNDHNWLISVMNTPDGRFDILMSTFVVAETGNTNNDITIDDNTATLEFNANFSELTHLETVAGANNYTVDWSGATVDIYGHNFDPLDGDRLLVGKIDADTPGDIEDIFLRIDDEAEILYYLDVYGITFTDDLSNATAEDGSAFPGFDTSGIWLLGVECTTCTSPAPLLLTIVDVVEDES